MFFKKISEKIPNEISISQMINTLVIGIPCMVPHWTFLNFGVEETFKKVFLTFSSLSLHLFETVPIAAPRTSS